MRYHGSLVSKTQFWRCNITRARRTFLWSGALFFVVVLSLALCEYVANSAAQRNAQRLLRDVHSITVNESTAEDVERIAEKFSGVEGPFPGYCDKIDSVRSIEASSTSLNWIGRKMPRLRWFGNSVWQAQAHFAISEGRVCFVEYKISANPSALAGSLYVLSAKVNNYRPYVQFPDFSYGVGMRNLHYIHDLSAGVTTLGSPDEHRRAFDFDLSCLSRFAGCRSVCELMPSAWLDYQTQATEKGWQIPAEELSDSRCQKR